MSKSEAAYVILKERGTAMHVDEIMDIALSRGLVETRSKSPADILDAHLYLENKSRSRRGVQLRFEKVGPSTWALLEWGHPNRRKSD